MGYNHKSAAENSKKKKTSKEAVTQIEDDPLFTSMDSDSLDGIPDDSYFCKLPMNTEIDPPTKRKSSCNMPVSKTLVVLDKIINA